MEKLMSLRRSIEQLRPARIEPTNYIAKIQYLLEDIQFPKDIFKGFDFEQTQTSDRAAVQIRVSSSDRDSDRDEILRRLKNAGIMANLKSTNSSVDPIAGQIDGTKFVINVKPQRVVWVRALLMLVLQNFFLVLHLKKNYSQKTPLTLWKKLWQLI